MKILHEITQNGSVAARIFSSEVAPRKNRLHIHYHSSIELSLIESGSGVYTSGGRSYPIHPGSIFFFRPNEAHFVSDVDEGGMRFLNLHITPHYLYTSFPNATAAEYGKLLAANFPLASHRINDATGEEGAREIALLLHRTEAELAAKASDYLLLANNYISSMFILLARAYGTGDGAEANEMKNHRRIVAAIAYMDAHFASDITLEEIAAQVGYSRCYFSSVFRKCMGMSAWDYICLKRIEAASSLIKTTDKSILEIATECGFNNAVNFYKTFKRFTNLSPGALRK